MIGACAHAIVRLCILTERLISQVKLAVYRVFLERSTLVTVMVPRKIVLHLLLLLTKQGNSKHYCLNHPLSCTAFNKPQFVLRQFICQQAMKGEEHVLERE